MARCDVRPVHAAMAEAAGDRNVWVEGGGLAGQFYDARQLDELIIQVTPLTLGEGKPVFPRKVTHPPLRLVEATTFAPFVEVRRCRSRRSRPVRTAAAGR